MKQYTERKVVMFSKKQIESFEILKSYNINISNFIRIAVREKIKRDFKKIKENEEYFPF